ncbi:LysE family transporter [Pseudaeromonas sharmana]|uniref:LysE family transporter n=1 Tax=Pseudaeromonas sharmana TaxID=328412 RepID=A0ABV8CJ28_9GAMM
MTLETWLGFFVACWIISLSPGAGAIASMSSGLRHGFRHGYWNVLGLQLALAGQIAIVAAGVGAILTTSAMAFNVIKWFGVGYLVWLAWCQWRTIPQARDVMPEEASALTPRWQLVLRGFLVNASNPKAIVFMLAVLPQFINPASPLLPQYLLMALTMITVDMIVMAGYTGLASRLLRLQRSVRQQRRINRTFASLFVGAAALLATVHRAQH